MKADPDFAPGYVGLADCHQLLATNWQLDMKSNHENAKAMITKALTLDPNMAEAHATTGLLLTSEFRLKEAAEALRHALSLNPNYAPAHLWYFQILLARREFDLAREQIEKAIELDPLATNVQLNYGGFYTAQHDYPAGLALLKRAVEMNPQFPLGHRFLGALYGLMKMFSESRAEFDKASKLLEKAYPQVDLSNQAAIAFFQDDKDKLRQLLPALEANLEEAFDDTLSIANYHFRLGDQNKGFMWLERGYARRDPSMMAITIDPFLSDAVRADPRYKALLKKMQLD